MIARIFTAEKEPVFCTLRKNRFSVHSGLRFAFTKTEKERQKKRQLQLNIYKQINTWELLFDLLLKLDLYFTKSFSDHLTF